MPLGHYHQRRRHICGEDGEGAARCGGPGSAIQIPDLGEDGVYDNHFPRCVQHFYDEPLLPIPKCHGWKSVSC